MESWDKALSLLTHIEDYAPDFALIFESMHALRVTNDDFMHLVMAPPIAPRADGSDTIVGMHVRCAVGLRVELVPPLVPQGVGTLTQVRCGYIELLYT